jgi:hypothetical protein
VIPVLQCRRRGNVKLDSQVVPKKDIFHYSVSMLKKDGGIDENVSHKIKVS